MKSWKEELKCDSIQSLAESNNPSIRYYTLQKIMDIPIDDPRLAKEKINIQKSNMIVSLLEKQNSDGSWGKQEGSLKRFTGTLWQVLILLELGCDPNRIELKKAIKNIFDKGFDDKKGYLVNHKGLPNAPCYQGQILWASLTCNYNDDYRVEKIINWIITNIEFHDGDINVNNPDDMCLGSHTCIRGAIPVIQSLAGIPNDMKSKRINRIL